MHLPRGVSRSGAHSRAPMEERKETDAWIALGGGGSMTVLRERERIAHW